MNIRLTMKADPDLIAVAQARNDGFRAELTGGEVHLSAGIVALGTANQAFIIEAVRRFDGFDNDDNPFDAHDIGDLEVELVEPGIATCRELIFFRVENRPLPPPQHATDPELNAGLVLTIMLASEW